jgi:hypothetical protein
MVATTIRSVVGAVGAERSWGREDESRPEMRLAAGLACAVAIL